METVGGRGPVDGKGELLALRSRPGSGDAVGRGFCRRPAALTWQRIARVLSDPLRLGAQLVQPLPADGRGDNSGLRSAAALCRSVQGGQGGVRREGDGGHRAGIRWSTVGNASKARPVAVSRPRHVLGPGVLAGRRIGVQKRVPRRPVNALLPSKPMTPRAKEVLLAPIPASQSSITPERKNGPPSP